MRQSEVIKLVGGKRWYHQRFDGTPMFLGFIGEGEVKNEKRKPAGTEADVRVCFYAAEKADWYLSMADIGRGANKIIELAKKDSNISKKLLSAWKSDEQKFENFVWREFPRIQLKKLDNKALLNLWKGYCRLAINRFTSSSVIDHFALGTDELIGRLIRKETGVRPGSKLTEVFAVATAPVHQSFINQAEIDLLKIASKDSKETLKAYQQRYFWINNNYAFAKNLTTQFFKREIKAWRQSSKNLYQAWRKIQNTPIHNKKAKAALFKKFHFSKLLKTLIKISEDFTWWQDERKKATYLNIHIGSKLLEEIGRRIGYKLEELKYALPHEIENLLKNKIPPRKELKGRRQACVYIVTRDGSIIKSGRAEIEKIKKTMLAGETLSGIKDVRGLSANVGRAIGPVRVVKSATEIAKVRTGDILIAVMTRPDYVPAMKRAAAIVTNEGGITSHAAIVSRELGIPCIIGTKIATEVFRDGDKVEVNANHGWVRKITE